MDETPLPEVRMLTASLRIGWALGHCALLETKDKILHSQLARALVESLHNGSLSPFNPLELRELVARLYNAQRNHTL